jgi:hypothetical protein
MLLHHGYSRVKTRGRKRMPGITGIIRVDDQPAAVDAAVSKLHHSPSYRSARIQPTPSISLEVVYRKDAAHEYDWHDDAQAQVTIFVNGTMVCAEPTPHILCAVDVLHEYLAHGFERWGQFEGGFVAVIVDLRQERVFIVNDHLGGLPLYYASRPGVFAFSPEAKGVLVHDGFDVSLSPPGLVNFLSAGYCFGELTLFEGLSMLEPSTLLSVHLQTLAVDKRRLWRIVYEPTPELLRRRAAEDALAQAIITAHQVTLCDAPSHVAVLLSGGWDSRGMLAALQRIDCKANIAQSRGIRDDIPASDVFIARRLAEAFGIPFVFGAYNTDGFVENAARWCYLSDSSVVICHAKVGLLPLDQADYADTDQRVCDGIADYCTCARGHRPHRGLPRLV